MLSWLSKTYKHKCPDGSVKRIYRNADDAFPLFLPGWEGKISGNVKALENIDVGIKSEYATKIQGLLYNLDELNQSLMMKFRGAYVAYQNDPCKNDGFFQRQIERIIEEESRLKVIKFKIQGLITLAERDNKNPEKIISIFQDIVTEIGGKAIPDAAKIEIDETRKIAEKLRGDENDN